MTWSAGCQAYGVDVRQGNDRLRNVSGVTLGSSGLLVGSKR